MLVSNWSGQLSAVLIGPDGFKTVRTDLKLSDSFKTVRVSNRSSTYILQINLLQINLNVINRVNIEGVISLVGGGARHRTRMQYAGRVPGSRLSVHAQNSLVVSQSATYVRQGCGISLDVLST